MFSSSVLLTDDGGSGDLVCGAQDISELKRAQESLSAQLDENTRLYRKLRAGSVQMELVDRISCIMTSTLDIERVYSEFATEMKKLVEFDQVTVNIISRDQESFTLSIYSER